MDDAIPQPAARPPIELKVEYKRLNSFFADYTRNISRGGTFIKTGRPLPVGTEFIFKLIVPRIEKPLLIHGQVERIVTTEEDEARRAPVADDEGAGMSIKFIYQIGDSRDAIARTVEKLMVDCLGQRLYGKLIERGAARAEARRSA